MFRGFSEPKFGYQWAFQWLPWPLSDRKGPRYSWVTKFRPRKPTKHPLNPSWRLLYESSKTYPYARGLAGQEIVDLWGSKRPTPTAKPTGKCGGRSPPPFPVGFAVGGGRLDPQNRRFPARPAPGHKDKLWSSHYNYLCVLAHALVVVTLAGDMYTHPTARHGTAGMDSACGPRGAAHPAALAEKIRY